MKSSAPVLLVSCALWLAAPAWAMVVFEDGFDTNSTSNFSFSGQNLAAWGAGGGKLQSALTQTPHNPTSPGFAAIVGLNTSSHFKLEADVQVVGSQPTTNIGHVGFFWGGSGEIYSIAYLRTHQDHVTAFKSPFVSELITGLGFDAVNAVDLNGQSYHLAVEVNYVAQSMIVSLDGISATYVGADFLKANSAGGVGGALGVISWGERVSYDNVRLTDYTATAVPEPGTVALMLAGLLAIRTHAAKRREAHREGSPTLQTA